ncbi:MAG: extracellular solute-binding protein [Myxococcota bacterium]
MRTPQIAAIVVAFGLFGVLGAINCNDQANPIESPETAETTDTQPEATAYNLEIPEVTYTLSPNAGDKAVSSEMGGPGFTGEGWDTNLTFEAIGVPEAIRGGEITQYIPDWPATLRMYGQNANTTFNYYYVGMLCFEPLLKIHPNTLELIPRLATHWQISEDKKTYRFRINPEARWSDGKEVVAADVIATWKLLVDPGLLSPSTMTTYSRFEEPVAVSKYIVEVKVKEESWQNFLAFANFWILPAHELDGLSGSEFLDKYQFDYVANSGPYTVKKDDIVTGQSLTVTRRDDWWAEGNPAFTGMYNIERYKNIVVKDPNLAFEKLKKGELDYMLVPKAQWWVEEMPTLDSVERGLLVMRKFYNDKPIGFSGIAINQARPPLDDVRVRKALQHLYDRKTMIEKLYYNEYDPLTSYYQGDTYANPDNPLLEYDEILAVELLEAAGWTEVNGEGYRVKDGNELSFTLQYASKLTVRSLTIFQEAAKRAGIKIELQELTPAARWKNVTSKSFDLSSQGWGSGPFPVPETMWKSSLADSTSNNNITSFRSEPVDALIEAYLAEYDSEQRKGIIKEMDSLIYQEHPYILAWYNPAQRVAFWNQIKMPEWGSARTFGADRLHYVWWIDPDLEKQLTAARADESLKMDPGEQNNRFWGQWAEAQEKATATANTVTPAPSPGEK